MGRSISWGNEGGGGGTTDPGPSTPVSDFLEEGGEVQAPVSFKEGVLFEGVVQVPDPSGPNHAVNYSTLVDVVEGSRAQGVLYAECVDTAGLAVSAYVVGANIGGYITKAGDTVLRAAGNSPLNGLYAVGPTPVRSAAMDTWAEVYSSQIIVAAINGWRAVVPATGTLGTTGITFINPNSGAIPAVGDTTVFGQKTFDAPPIIPTAILTDSSTKAANTAFVQALVGDRLRVFAAWPTGGVDGQRGVATFQPYVGQVLVRRDGSWAVDNNAYAWEDLPNPTSNTGAEVLVTTIAGQPVFWPMHSDGVRYWPQGGVLPILNPFAAATLNGSTAASEATARTITLPANLLVDRCRLQIHREWRLSKTAVGTRTDRVYLVNDLGQSVVISNPGIVAERGVANPKTEVMLRTGATQFFPSPGDNYFGATASSVGIEPTFTAIGQQVQVQFRMGWPAGSNSDTAVLEHTAVLVNFARGI